MKFLCRALSAAPTPDGRRWLLLAVACASLGGWLSTSLAAQDWMMQAKIEGYPVEGRIILAQPQEAALLLRDGELLRFSPKKATDFRRAPTPFRPFSQSEMRGQLMREFGQGFQVSGAGKYLVVHPTGQRDLWAARFETISRSFHSYFSAQSYPLQQAVFPLVAVIFPNREEFARAAARAGTPISKGVLGFYSPTTNRILMYDFTTHGDAASWYVNAETIIHEAVHQIAFNTGVHNRFAPQPRWLVEGLGTMYEASGVWNGRSASRRIDRINRYRLNAFRTYSAQRRESGAIAEIVSSDRMFQTDPEGAYAEAWALTFYLAENQPRQYAQLLLTAANRPNFRDYLGAERLRDFQAIFGTNLQLLEAQMLRFMASLE